MKIGDAKQIPLPVIIEHLGGRFCKKGKPGESWYYSPFRPEEKTASFKLDEISNKWHDFGHVSLSNGQKSGGDILDLWCDYHNLDRRTGIREALKELEKFALLPQQSAVYKLAKENLQKDTQKKEDPEPSQFKILKIHSSIFYPSLKEELQRRRISLPLANTYLKQGYILDTRTKKTYNGFLFENDKGGFEISIPNPAKEECIKRSTKPKTLTTIRGSKDTQSADIFEGFWDFLSWLEINKIKNKQNHSIVLNSLSFCSEAVNRIIELKQQIDSVFLFMDNDDTGFAATHFLIKELAKCNLIIGTRECIYKDFKDLNDFWKNTAFDLRS